MTQTAAAEHQPAGKCRIETPLRGFGRFVGRHPLAVWLFSFTLCVALAISGWVSKWGSYMTHLDFAKEWSVQGGHLEKEYDLYHDNHNDEWFQDYHVTMMVGREPGTDLFTPEVWAETEALYAKYFDISVTTEAGHTYTTWDLCARGTMPDPETPPSLYMPCKLVSPNHCFSDYTEYLHASYVAVDANISQTPLAAQGGLSYATRPSWRDSDADGELMKQTAFPNGCNWWTANAVFAPDTWSAKVEKDDSGTVTSVPAMRWMLYSEAPKRAAFRMSLQQPEKANLEEVREALHLHSEEWHKLVVEYTKNSPLVEFSNLRPDFLEKIEHEMEQPPWLLVAIGGILMGLFVKITFTSLSRPLMSRVMIAMLGLQCVVIAVVTSGGFILVCGFQYGAAMIACLPFLGLGLGVNDTFVLIRYFSDLVAKGWMKEDRSEILGELMAQAGPGVTLTSLCNTIAFAIGSSLPVPAMKYLCIGAAMVSAINYFVVLTQFLPLMCLEISRIQARKAEPGLAACQNKALNASALRDGDDNSGASEEFQPRECEGSFDRFLETKLAPFYAKLPVSLVTIILSLAFLGVCCYFISQKLIGYRPHEISPVNMHEHRGLEMLFSWFSFFPAQIAFTDLDVPANQYHLHTILGEVAATPNALPDALPSFLAMFTYYVQQYAAVTNNTAVLDPYGMVTSDPTTFYALYESWNNLPIDNPEAAFLDSTFVYADMVRANEFAYNEDGSIKMAFLPFYQFNMETDEDIVQSIHDIREVIDNSPISDKAFPIGDLFTYWQVFMAIDPILWRSLGLVIAVIFACTMLLLRSPLAAFCAAFACAMIVLELYGICMLFLKFNVLIAAGLMACAGMSVEFTAHSVAAFSLEEGTVQERLAAAMKHTYMAMILGSISTLIGVIPLAFHPVPFIVKYQFVPFVLAAFIGTLTGLFVLPAYLVLAGKMGDMVKRK